MNDQISTRITHYYHSNQYDEAIDYLHSIKTTHDDQQQAVINFWLGRSYFKKTENKISIYRQPGYVLVKGNMIPPPKNLLIHSNTRMSQQALIFFQYAINANPLLHLAHYWKGKALQYEKKITEAYECFIRALSLSCDNEKYLRKCSIIFSDYQNLTFLEGRETYLDSLNIANLLTLFDSNSASAYCRMEICKSIKRKFPNSSDEIRNQMKKVIALLAGQRIFDYFVPFTGDDDDRVRQLARTILLTLE